MDRCWLQGQLGDALHAVLCATGYNLRWVAAGHAPSRLEGRFLAASFTGADATDRQLVGNASVRSIRISG
jgi:hypothetical protein